MPRIVGSLVERRLFVDRDAEQRNLTEWLKQESKKVVVIKAASGYGKTSLAMEVLHHLAPDGELDAKLDAVLIFLCRDREGTFRELCKKVDARLGGKNDSFLVRYDDFLLQRQQSPEIIPDEIIKDISGELAKLGNVWLVFDNFETILMNNRINTAHLAAFFEKALQVDGLHFLLTSQKVPEFQTLADVEELEINDLPADFALDFLREEGEKLKAGSRRIDCGLAEITDANVAELKQKGFALVPMSLVALVGYLKASYPKYGVTLASVLQNDQIFAKFREHDAKDAKTGSMYLIELQYKALSADERLILKSVSIFPAAIEFPVLAEILKGYADEDTIAGVLTGNTLVRRIDKNLYELLPQAREIISKQPDKEDEKVTCQQLHFHAAAFYYSIRQPVAQCYTREDFAPYFSTIDHLTAAGDYDLAVNFFNEIILKLIALGYMNEIIGRSRLLVGKLSEPSIEASNLYNLGLALYSFGRLNEAIIEHNKAISIRKPLVESGRIDLANDLAADYMNKSNAFFSFCKMNEAIAELDKAIDI